MPRPKRAKVAPSSKRAVRTESEKSKSQGVVTQSVAAALTENTSRRRSMRHSTAFTSETIDSHTAAEPISSNNAIPTKMSQDHAGSDVAERRKTPPLEDDDLSDSGDLYDLSPSGEASQLRIREQFAARRQSQQHRPPSVHGTPGPDSSVFSRWQPRARQGSIVRVMQRGSSAGILSDLDMDASLADFDLPPPDGESTPLNLNGQRKSRRLTASQNVPSSGASTSSSRKRKADDSILVPQSSNVRSSPPSSPTKALLSTEHGLLYEGQNHNDTMADPLSSSPVSTPNIVETIEHRISKPRKTRATSTAMALIGPAKKSRQIAQSKAMSTAQLQDLLPKPRVKSKPQAMQKIVDVFSIASSDDAAEELPIKSPIAKRGTKKQPLRKASGNCKRATTPAQTSTTMKKAPLGSAAKIKRMYGRPLLGTGQENDMAVLDVPPSDDEDNSDVEIVLKRSRPRSRTAPKKDADATITKSKALKAVQLKFAEVDKWELNFESVDLGGNSSDWR